MIIPGGRTAKYAQQTIDNGKLVLSDQPADRSNIPFITVKSEYDDYIGAGRPGAGKRDRGQVRFSHGILTERLRPVNGNRTLSRFPCGDIMYKARWIKRSVLLIFLSVFFNGDVAGETKITDVDSFGGDWVWIFDFRPGLIVETKAKFVLDRNILGGHVRFGVERQVELKISEGKVDGKNISFVVKDNFNNMDTTYTYTGELHNGKIIGKVHFSFSTTESGKTNSGDLLWEASRPPATAPAKK
jgi:hypothetical protein